MRAEPASNDQHTGISLDRPMALAAAGAGAGAVIGSLGPWLKATLPFFGTITINGTDGNNDGVITLIAGAIAGLLLLIAALRPTATRDLRSMVVIGAIGFAVVAAVAIYDWINLSNNIEDMDSEFRSLVSPGWGLYVTAISGVVGFFLSIATYSDLRSESVETSSSIEPSEESDL